MRQRPIIVTLTGAGIPTRDYEAWHAYVEEKLPAMARRRVEVRFDADALDDGITVNDVMSFEQKADEVEAIQEGIAILFDEFRDGDRLPTRGAS